MANSEKTTYSGTYLIEVRGDADVEFNGYPLNGGWHFEECSIYWIIPSKNMRDNEDIEIC